MGQVRINIDGGDVSVKEGLSLRNALLDSGVYIPGLCDHPDLDAFKPFNWSERVWQGATVIPAHAGVEQRAAIQASAEKTPTGLDSRLRGNDSGSSPTIDAPHCNLCLVSINGSEPQRCCDVRVADGIVVTTDRAEIIAARKASLKKILARHPHACLTCPERHGCDRIQCSMNVPELERCCELLGRCEIGKVADWIGIPNDTPAYHNEGRPRIKDEPLFVRDYELCIGCTRCVRVCRDVRGVDILGAVIEGGSISVGTTGGASLVESLCRFCGACVEVCPTGALRDQPGSKPLIGTMAPCSARCPLKIDVPGYMELIAQGENFAALELIRERAVLPGVLGYACFHPCEENCRRDSLDGSASICALKRYVSDIAGDEPPRIVKNDSTGKRVAIIGGGPAGLAASADLLRFGHEAVIFDRAGDLGGMLRQTLPDFRLPDGVIDRDLNYLSQLGLKTRLDVTFGEQVQLDDLRKEGFDAVVVAVGLGGPLRLNVEGEDLPQVSSGLYLLREAARCEANDLSGRVVVVGGGAVAVDAAMTVRRLGAADVMMVCLEGEAEMPAHAEEIEFARQEGVTILNGWGVVRFDPSLDGGVSVALKQCLSVFDARGTFNPTFDAGTTRKIETDWVIAAIGQKREIDITELRNSPDVFLAGDVSLGATSIVEAMADGRKVALQVDKFLGGKGLLPTIERAAGKPFIGRDEEFHFRKRAEPAMVEPATRVGSMTPFVRTLTPEQALSEAGRCLRCHLRARITPPVLPPDPWQKFGADLLDKIPPIEGVIILADGQKKTLKIAGAPNMQRAFDELLHDGIAAEFCHWEADPMFTKRESELIQAHLQAFGEIPGAGDLDDLF